MHEMFQKGDNRNYFFSLLLVDLSGGQKLKHRLNLRFCENWSDAIVYTIQYGMIVVILFLQRKLKII